MGVGLAMQHAAAPLHEAPESPYEEDFVLWAEHQARLLRDGRLKELDIAHLIEEVVGVGDSYRDEIESRLTVLLAHLLKWKYRPGHRCGSWRGTLLEQRRRIARVIQRSPSLHAYPQDIFDDGYLSARLAGERDRHGLHAVSRRSAVHARRSARSGVPPPGTGS